MIFNQKVGIACLFIFMLASLVTINQNAYAISDNRGLTLSPLRSEIDINPGTSLEGKLTVTNSTDKVMNVMFSAEKFSVINQQYDYAFSEETNEINWIRFDASEVNLKPGDSEDVRYTIAVPLSAEPGGRYISLFASTDTSGDSDGINSKQRVASLLYITVLGDVSRSGSLISLSSPWLVTGKSSWTIVLRNSGTTHFRSRYSVEVNDIFGNKISDNNFDSLILPGTARLITSDLPPISMPGIYKVVYNIGLGDTPATSETRWLVFLPPYAGLIIVVMITTIASLILRSKRSKN